MNLVVATIPENPAELAGWLERRLVGLGLDGLVAELTALHQPASADASIEQLLPKVKALSEKRNEFRHVGYSADRIDQVLAEPAKYSTQGLLPKTQRHEPCAIVTLLAEVIQRSRLQLKGRRRARQVSGGGASESVPLSPGGVLESVPVPPSGLSAGVTVQAARAPAPIASNRTE